MRDLRYNRSCGLFQCTARSVQVHEYEGVMFRSFFLYLSASARARKVLMALPFATRVARRFVAGETLDDAIRAVRTLNAKGILATLDHLGENVHTEADANRAAGEYVALLDRLAQTGINSNV